MVNFRNKKNKIETYQYIRTHVHTYTGILPYSRTPTLRVEEMMEFENCYLTTDSGKIHQSMLMLWGEALKSRTLHTQSQRISSYKCPLIRFTVEKPDSPHLNSQKFSSETGNTKARALCNYALRRTEHLFWDVPARNSDPNPLMRKHQATSNCRTVDGVTGLTS